MEMFRVHIRTNVTSEHIYEELVSGTDPDDAIQRSLDRLDHRAPERFPVRIEVVTEVVTTADAHEDDGGTALASRDGIGLDLGETEIDC